MWYYVTKNINGDPRGAVLYATKAWIELCEKGHANGRWLPFKSSDSAWCAVDFDGQMFGILVYSLNDDQCKVTIEIGYVSPGHRKKGIYKKLMKHLLYELQGKPYYTIESVVYPENKNMMEIVDKQKRDVLTTTRININHNV